MDDENKYYPLTDVEKLRQKLSGMTVNERLLETSQLDAFVKAEGNKDLVTVREILESIFVDTKSIEMILQTIGQ